MPMTFGPPVILPGTAPTYFSIPISSEWQYITIEGSDGLRYVGRWQRKFRNIIINDPMEFTVEGRWLFVHGLKPNEAFRLELVSTTRLPE